jgi:hypothetical protein
MPADTCGLCEAPFGGDGHDRVGGVALCRRCFLGDVRRVATARGWMLRSEHEQYSPREYDESSMLYRTQVRVTLAGDTDLELHVQRRTWWRGLLGLVKSRARSSDPLFDGHVCVWTRRPARVEEFFRGDGVESSLMEVLGNILSSYVKLRGGTIEVHYVADDPHTEGEIVARACVLAHHLGALLGQAPTDPEAIQGSVYGAPRRSQ